MMIKNNKSLKIALIADALTTCALDKEATIFTITPYNYKLILKIFKPDFLFVESAWQGHKNKWKFKIASYDDHPKRHNKKLQKVVAYAKKLGIPTIFWNKEDGVHFDRFINSAKFFDHIFTVDENCIPKYKEVVGTEVSVNTLMFAVQKDIHNFTGFNFKHKRANFMGSYSHHIHEQRRVWQDMAFSAASKSGLGLSVYDRNSKRKPSHYRYPPLDHQEIEKSVKYTQTAQVYKDNLVSINVNTVTDSKTMFSRRLVEILACGGIVMSNDCPSVRKYFKDFCYIVDTQEEAQILFERLKTGPNKEDLKRAEAGAKYVAAHHTWTHRLDEVLSVIN